MFAFKEFVIANGLDKKGLESMLDDGKLALILHGSEKYISQDNGERNALLSSAIGLDEYQRINRSNARDLKRRVKSGKNMVLKTSGESYVLNTSISKYLAHKLATDELTDSSMGPELVTTGLFGQIYPGKRYAKLAEKDTSAIARKVLKGNIVDFTENHGILVQA